MALRSNSSKVTQRKKIRKYEKSIVKKKSKIVKKKTLRGVKSEKVKIDQRAIKTRRKVDQNIKEKNTINMFERKVKTKTKIINKAEESTSRRVKKIKCNQTKTYTYQRVREDEKSRSGKTHADQNY